MFLHVSVILFTGGCLPHTPGQTPPGRQPPGQTPPLGQTPTWADTPPWQTPPPCAAHAGRYGQQAGGTHPTGMQSCFSRCFTCVIS